LDLPQTYVPPSTPGSDDAQHLVVDQDIPAQWWNAFHSERLNGLVRASLEHNPSVDAARASLRAAMEQVYAQQAAYFPTVNASFSPTRQKIARTLASPASSGVSYYNLYTAQLDISYSPDVFGLNRRQVESLQAQADLQRFQFEATYLTLTSNVVNAAIGEASLRGQISATREIIASQSKTLDILKRQRELGDAADADVLAQEAALAVSEASLPPLEKQLALQRDLLVALVGAYPGQSQIPPFELEAFELPAELPLTLPSALVEHRPDVLAAEEQLHSASAAVGVAVANRLPNIALGVDSYGSASLALSKLFTSGTGFWDLAASVTQPVFDAGALSHRQSAAEAEYDAAAAQYRSTVISAFQNVADALQAISADATALRTAVKAENATGRSLAIASRQVELGDLSPLALLSIEQAYQQARLNRVVAQAERLQDTVGLFQALGGGWWNREPTAAVAAGK
jgi:NodT family efflux transporter outer membrane factor (OMF) lipoprotein